MMRRTPVVQLWTLKLNARYIRNAAARTAQSWPRNVESSSCESVKHCRSIGKGKYDQYETSSQSHRGVGHDRVRRVFRWRSTDSRRASLVHAVRSPYEYRHGRKHTDVDDIYFRIGHLECCRRFGRVAFRISAQ